mmetsp:Transcript_6336/g.19126  ORF Transcript_6336/g.19126 Transcript_6336/m.19126 type:complete len:323 (-) Transcript_6336:273-1241(-)
MELPISASLPASCKKLTASATVLENTSVTIHEVPMANLRQLSTGPGTGKSDVRNTIRMALHAFGSAAWPSLPNLPKDLTKSNPGVGGYLSRCRNAVSRPAPNTVSNRCCNDCRNSGADHPLSSLPTALCLSSMPRMIQQRRPSSRLLSWRRREPGSASASRTSLSGGMRPSLAGCPKSAESRGNTPGPKTSRNRPTSAKTSGSTSRVRRSRTLRTFGLNSSSPPCLWLAGSTTTGVAPAGAELAAASAAKALASSSEATFISSSTLSSRSSASNAALASRNASYAWRQAPASAALAGVGAGSATATQGFDACSRSRRSCSAS